MSEKNKDNFERGIFWELYQDLEQQFQNFLDYVPYDCNENTYSFKLLNLILSIGGHVDSAFKEMARYPKFSDNDDCKEILRKIKNKDTVPITLPLKAFETEYKLSERTIIFKRLPERVSVKPFKPRSASAQSPKWWKIYNGIKHDVSINIRQANLRNTLHALAGAFLLNVRHTPAILRFYDYALDNVLKLHKPFTSGVSKYPLTDIPDRNHFQEIVENKQRFSGHAETFLFIYDYEQ